MSIFWFYMPFSAAACLSCPCLSCLLIPRVTVLVRAPLKHLSAVSPTIKLTSAVSQAVFSPGLVQPCSVGSQRTAEETKILSPYNVVPFHPNQVVWCFYFFYFFKPSYIVICWSVWPSSQNSALAASLFLYIHSNFIKIKKAFVGCKINMK